MLDLPMLPPPPPAVVVGALVAVCVAVVGVAAAGPVPPREGGPPPEPAATAPAVLSSIAQTNASANSIGDDRRGSLGTGGLSVNSATNARPSASLGRSAIGCERLLHRRRLRRVPVRLLVVLVLLVIDALGVDRP